MEREDKNDDEKESVNSSSPDNSPRGNYDQEKDEERSARGGPLKANKDTQNKEGKLEGSKHGGGDSSGSDSENPNKRSGSDSDNMDKRKTTTKVHAVAVSSLDSEKLEKRCPTTEEVYRESDSDSDSPNKMCQTAAEVIVEKESCSNSENLGTKSRTTEKTEESHSESEKPYKIRQTADEVRGADKESDSDSETPDKKSQNIGKLAKASDCDSEKPNKAWPTTKRILTEEERGLDCESPITLSRTVQEFTADRGEDLDMEAMSGSSSQSIDKDTAEQTSTWPGKAAALKLFVKMKGAVTVTNVLRRLSGGKDDGLPDPEDKSSSSVRNPVEEQAMKGRVILYTRLGCQECKEVRSFLHQKRLKPVEINVDIYPSRKLELEQKTGSSFVPCLYFNNFLVRGLSELKAMEESSKLDEKINDLINEEPSSAAPLPPMPGEDDVSGSGKVDELASVVRKLKESISLGDRFYKMRRFNNCFLGSEAVDLLSQDQCLEREEAIEYGRKLGKNHFFQHVLEENVFEDGNHLYRFLEHDPSISTQCYNMTRGLIEFKPKPIIEIASRLRFLSFAIFEAYVSEDGRHVDYSSINGCEEFTRYLRVIEELQRVNLNGLSREEKLAFFINLYNMMSIHAILAWGHPTGALDRRKYFGDFKYVVGGSFYSLSEIQNGILRGNQRPPYSLSKPFGPRDKRFKVALPYSEPLIHFALVYGTRSGPALRCYSPANIDQELMEAARSFLMTGGVVLDTGTKVVSVNKILQWYSADFGKSEAEVIKHAANYLEPSKSQQLLDLQANNQLKVTYQPYDWGLNC